jgi:hypothetical protein
VEPLFTFVGSYWWLVFPAMGVMASVGSAWERGARRRHRRRLEVLKAKAELKAAQAAARGRTGPVTIAATATAPLSMATTIPHASTTFAAGSTAAQLERLFASHDQVTSRWLEYELDVAKIIAFPAMSDGRQPLTAAFLRAKRIADGLRPASAKAKLTKEQLSEYRNAVADFEVAFDVAERDARRLKDSSFTEVERKRLDTAKNLLSIAVDQAATPAERQLAYKRVREELDGLISLSDEAIEVLEIKVALQLDAPVSATSAPQPEKVREPQPEKPPAPGAREHAPWPVPARNADTAPGRVIHPKSPS